MSFLNQISSNQDFSLYSLNNNENCFIASCQETQNICNDPTVLGLNYTNQLKVAVSKTLSALKINNLISINESNSSVVNILRGGLNFNLREALNLAYGWNRHNSFFLSAQRKLVDPVNQSWIITENHYSKVDFQDQNTLLIADVVATGVSLEYTLNFLFDLAIQQNKEINNVILFTIGGPKAIEILKSVFEKYSHSCNLTDYKVIFFEGIFALAERDTKLSIKIPGTDLLRVNSTLTPEFIESQFSNPCYPIERCTIYDAGSRAYHIEEYLLDVIDYWQLVLEQAQQGRSYLNLLSERMPEISEKFSKNIDLIDLASNQINKLKKLI